SRTLPDYGTAPNLRAVFTDCIARLNGVAAALTAVGALDADRADEILLQFQAALAVRHRLHPQTAGPLLRSARPRPVTVGGAAGAAGPAGAPGPEAASPWQVWPVGRMLPFRDEFVAGELYVLSLLVTADRAQALAVAPMRPVLTGLGRHTAVPLPLETATARDDQGTSYQVMVYGGGDGSHWQGHLDIEPAPPAGAKWLELAVGDGSFQLRIDLTAPVPPADVTARPQDRQPGEQLLEHVAQQILVTTDRHPGDTRRQAYALGDVVAGLEAAGALSPFSPVPGHLAMICERLGIGGHGLTATPTADLPPSWFGVLSWYGRRHRPPVHDGTASAGTLLPDVDGSRVMVGGLHTRDGQTQLHVVVGRERPGRLVVDAGPLSHQGFCCWLRDDGGQWHVAVPGSWRSSGHEVTGSLQVLPPLGRDTTRVTLLASTLTSQVQAEVPLHWWAAP
ncbi:MAG TPA: hypothetical protein VGI21_24870, partial [Streptosporangiaceae bacterium]